MSRSLAVCLSLAAGLLSAWPVLAQEGGSCASEEATELFREGFAAAKDLDSKQAMASFKSCLEVEPDCLPCLYELGWVYWIRGSWKSCVASWEKVVELSISRLRPLGKVLGNTLVTRSSSSLSA